ncbi:DUF2800 domain-containing protein [Dehalobacter sp. TeCB1]|uniref:DUF2800 domain-containing protein n=1 Tax=Dehalobacter sp. TeCB1 TaxID=1843715 RepID=UPI00083B65CA|nr:DUF2800 domain-containing protein [Dehalobacter sp. TeCB1]OCZ54336.1 hypothetical protein A7D23_06100 [Dehalobacter sp. TeCB1]
MTQHAERKHAFLSASKAEQWLSCPPSAKLQDGLPDSRSNYADEGTTAHELAEIKLRQRLTVCNSVARKTLAERMETIKASNYYGPEMENAIQEYVERVEERYMAAKARSSDAVLLLEERLDFTEWVPDGYGTGDVVIIADEILDVIDLKYGKGVPVSAVGNPQMRLYGLGAWFLYNFLYGINQINTTIIQPRLDSVSTDTIPLDELLDWAETVVKPTAKLAFAGEGEHKAGEHCRWCKVKGNCRARADENMKALEYEFKDPALMTLEEVGSILFIADQLKVWAKDVEEYAFGQAVAGNKVPQWKLVEGRSNRAFTDKNAAKAKLLQAGYEEEKILKPQELLGISDLESKILGKKVFKELLNDLVVKPQGKPVLVPETDNRAELNSLENDFKDIEMED